MKENTDVVLRHTFPIFTGLGPYPIVNWDFAGAVSIFGPDALPVVHQWLLPGLEPATSRVRVAAHNHWATAAMKEKRDLNITSVMKENTGYV